MNILNRRRLMGGMKGLPYDAEIEYLQGTGILYIDTGYKPKDNTELQINYVVTKLHSSLSNPLTPYGCRVGWLNKQYCIFSPANYADECHISYGNVDERLDSVTVLNQEITVHANSNVVTFGNITKSFQTGNLPNLNIFLFGLNNNGSLFSVNGFELNIKSFWIKEGNQFIIDMIPVRKGQVGYMYDKVSGKLFGNAGTGDFVLGSDIIEIEYLEGTGTLYIATDVLGNMYELSLEVECDFYYAAKNTKESQIVSAKNMPESNNGFCTFIDTSNRLYSWVVSGSAAQFGTLQLGNKYSMKVVFNKPKGRILTLNGVTTTVTTNSNDFSGGGTIALFMDSSYGVSLYALPSKIRIYNAKVKSDGKVILDAIPVRINSIGYMYDRVSRQFFGNAGTGDFILGPDKEGGVL